MKKSTYNKFLFPFFLFPLITFGLGVNPIFAEKHIEKRRRVYQNFSGYTQEDIKAEIKFGRNLAARILGRYKLVQDKKVSRYVSLLGTGIAAQIGRPELKYYFGVIDADDVNAYACPGGYIFLTKGALKSIHDEAQLVGILAHEIVHINQRHVVKKLKITGKDTSMTSSFAKIIGGSTSSVRALLDQLTDQAYLLLFEEGLDKQDEFESDTLAIQMLVNLNYDWSSYRNYVRDIKKSMRAGHGKVLSKTHPSVEDRIANIEKVALQNGMQNLLGKINKERFDEYVVD